EAGVVDEHVDGAELAARRFPQGVDVGLHGHVALDAGDAERAARLGEAALVDVADHDARALFDGALGDREADAGAGGGGDEDGLAVEEGVAGDVRRDVHDRASLSSRRSSSRFWTAPRTAASTSRTVSSSGSASGAQGGGTIGAPNR